MNFEYLCRTPDSRIVSTKVQPAFSTLLVLQEAERLGIHSENVVDTNYFKLTYKGHVEYFAWQVPSTTSASGRIITINKGATNAFLRDAGIQVSHGHRLKKDHTDDDATTLFYSLQQPLVVKPLAGTHGSKVYLGITTIEEYCHAIDEIFADHRYVDKGLLVEEMFQGGDEYRILCTREKVLGATYRVPANVVGNGTASITELIKEKNNDPRRGPSGKLSLVDIEVDEMVAAHLASQELTIESVPDKGEQIFLRKVSNLSQGGDSIDYTDKIHDSVKELALRSVQAIPGLSFAGVDFMTTDVTSQQDEDSYVIIELNGSPMLSMHDVPFEGENRHVSREFLFLMFPELR